MENHSFAMLLFRRLLQLKKQVLLIRTVSQYARWLKLLDSQRWVWLNTFSCNHSRFYMKSNMMRSSWVSISCAIQHDSGGYVEHVEFESIHHVKAVIYRHNEWYNQTRLHGSLGRMSPEEILFASDLNQSIPIKIKTKISQTFILNCLSNK